MWVPDAALTCLRAAASSLQYQSPRKPQMALCLEFWFLRSQSASARVGGICWPSQLSGKEPTCQSGRHFDSWVRKIPWRRKWQPTPVFLSKESHGQRSLLSYIQSMGSQRVRHSWVTENAHKHKEWNTHLLLASTMCQALCKNVCVHHFTSSFQLFYMICIIKPIFQVKKLRLKQIE